MVEYLAKTDKYSSAVLDIVKGWGSDIIVTRGNVHHPEFLDGILAIEYEKIVGIGLYKIDKDCEIVLLETFVKNKGIGTEIIDRIKAVAKNKKCERVWLVSDNTNSDAFRFYQKRGFSISNIHVNAMREARKIKPEIPLLVNGIELKDEIEYEVEL